MFTSLEQWLAGFILDPGGYVILFLFGTLATTIIPLSPEIAAITAWEIGMNTIVVIAVLAVSNYLGNALNYYIGYTGGHWVVTKRLRVKTKQLDRAAQLFDKYGPPVLFFSWLPFVGDPLTFVPGIVRYSFAKFSVWVFAGKVVWYILLYALFTKAGLGAVGAA